MKPMRLSLLLGAAVLTMTGAVAFAAETITYTYDVKGRLIKVEHAGLVNNGVKTEYTHDKADNRTKVKVIGAP